MVEHEWSSSAGELNVVEGAIGGILVEVLPDAGDLVPLELVNEYVVVLVVTTRLGLAPHDVAHHDSLVIGGDRLDLLRECADLIQLIGVTHHPLDPAAPFFPTGKAPPHRVGDSAGKRATELAGVDRRSELF